jgi:hypothetical protein
MNPVERASRTANTNRQRFIGDEPSLENSISTAARSRHTTAARGKKITRSFRNLRVRRRSNQIKPSVADGFNVETRLPGYGQELALEYKLQPEFAA